jgi:hypothetical protein
MVIGVMIGYGLYDYSTVFDFRQKKEYFLFSRKPRLVLGPTPPPI